MTISSLSLIFGFSAIRYSEKGIDIDLPKMIQKIPHPNADHSRDDLRGLVSEVMHRKLGMLSSLILSYLITTRTHW